MIDIYEPRDWQQAESIQVDSDAADNMSAIHESDEWAEANGFVRESSYWLRRVRRRRDDKLVYRVVLLRLSDDEMETRRMENQRVSEALAQMPETPHRVR